MARSMVSFEVVVVGLVDRQPQPRIAVEAAAAHLGGNGDFLDQAGCDLALLASWRPLRCWMFAHLL